MTFSNGAAVVAIGLLVLPVAPRLAAQEADPADVAPFVEVTEVRVVNVDVYVTTNDGEPVTDLVATDFHIEEDGRPVELTNFYKVVEGRPVEESLEAPPEVEIERQATPTPIPRPGPPPGFEQPQIPESQRLWLVVYLDNHNMNPIHRTRILDQLDQFIFATVADGNQGMLITYDQALKVHQPFTDSAPTLIRAIDALGKASGRPSSIASERAELLRRIEEAETIGTLSGQIRQYGKSIEIDLRYTIEAISDTMRSLAGLPGRKAILYVSDGMPISPAKDLYYAIKNKFNDAPALAYASEFNMIRELRQVEQLANSDRISFYTLDATGLQMPSGFSAENRGGASSNDLRSSVDSLHQSNYQDSIRRIAYRTGGVPILNTNNPGPALAQIGKSLRSYYSLGYTPPKQVDGRFHKIEVKVDRPGVQIRYREGYRHKDAATLIGETLQAGMRYGIQANPLDLQVETGQAEPYGDKFALLPITIRIPIGKLLLVPQGERHLSQLEVYFSALSEDGEVADLASDAVRLEIPPQDLETALTQFYRYDTKLQIRPGPQRLGVAVRDIFADKVSRVVFPVR